MDVNGWQILGGIASTAMMVGGAAWKIRQIESTKLVKQHDEAIANVSKTESEIRLWQAHEISKERVWREACETHRREDQNRHYEDMRVLRQQNIKLHDECVSLLKVLGDYRAQFHTINGELMAWRQTQQEGGRRHTDNLVPLLPLPKP